MSSIVETVDVEVPVSTAYNQWTQFESFPRFMEGVREIRQVDDTHTHWVAEVAGVTREFDATITEQHPDERIAWKSAEGADVRNTGAVEFLRAPGDRGTEVRATIAYEPPAGQAGRLLAKLWGEEPARQIEEDLRRFKSMMETGEVPTTEGQPSGRGAGAGS